MLERSKDPRVQHALHGDGTNLGNRQRIWRKALVQLGIIQKIEGTENLYEPGSNMFKLSEYIRYRVDIADQRLALTDAGDIIPGKRARPTQYDADVSASGDAFESVTGVETDVDRVVQIAVVVAVYVGAIVPNAMLLLATCHSKRS